MKPWAIFWILSLAALSGESYWKGEMIVPVDETPCKTIHTLRLEQNPLVLYTRYQFIPEVETAESLCLALSWKESFLWGPLQSRGLYSLGIEGHSWSVFREPANMSLNWSSRNFLNQGAVLKQDDFDFWLQKTQSRENCGAQGDFPSLSVVLRHSRLTETDNAEDQPWANYSGFKPEEIGHFLFLEKPVIAGFQTAGAFSFSSYTIPGWTGALYGSHTWGPFAWEILYQYQNDNFRTLNGDLTETSQMLDYQWDLTLPLYLYFKGQWSRLWMREGSAHGRWGLEAQYEGAEKFLWSLKGEGRYFAREEYSFPRIGLGHNGEISFLYWDIRGSLDKEKQRQEWDAVIGHPSKCFYAGVGFLKEEKLQLKDIGVHGSFSNWEGGLIFFPLEEKVEVTLKRIFQNS